MTMTWLWVLEIWYASSSRLNMSLLLQAYTSLEVLKHSHAMGSITQASAIHMEMLLTRTGLVVPVSTGSPMLPCDLEALAEVVGAIVEKVLNDHVVTALWAADGYLSYG
jgi:hypothetical protein